MNNIFMTFNKNFKITLIFSQKNFKYRAKRSYETSIILETWRADEIASFSATKNLKTLYRIENNLKKFFYKLI